MKCLFISSADHIEEEVVEALLKAAEASTLDVWKVMHDKISDEILDTLFGYNLIIIDIRKNMQVKLFVFQIVERAGKEKVTLNYLSEGISLTYAFKKEKLECKDYSKLFLIK